MRGLAIVTLIVVGLFGCTPRRSDAPAPPVDPTRMSHERHAMIACVACHQEGKRPGETDHQPCDDGKCHQKEFLKPPGLFCQVCHQSVASATDAKLKPYPAEDAWQSLPPRFSHRLHLDRGRIEARVGFHVTCVDCHTRGGTSTLAPPDHATCTRCHASEVGLANAPRMDDCGRCHITGSMPRRQRTLIKGDLRPFEHARHTADRKGTPIGCDTCHVDTRQAADSAHHPSPRIEACVTCHDDAERTSETSRMRVCESCHVDRTSTLTSIAPRNHLPLTERPIDHTIAFRRDHAEAASRSAARCATCHTQMSGNAQQACDECHQTMKPADHRLTWRELDHGPDATADRDRCASCHVTEFCSACHTQRPRSHGFNFLRDHGPLARVNVRPCLTCHGERAATGGGTDCDACHTAMATPRLRP